jgi:hypothetical protein
MGTGGSKPSTSFALTESMILAINRHTRNLTTQLQDLVEQDKFAAVRNAVFGVQILTDHIENCGSDVQLSQIREFLEKKIRDQHEIATEFLREQKAATQCCSLEDVRKVLKCWAGASFLLEVEKNSKEIVDDIKWEIHRHLDSYVERLNHNFNKPVLDRVISWDQSLNDLKNLHVWLQAHKEFEDFLTRSVSMILTHVDKIANDVNKKENLANCFMETGWVMRHYVDPQTMTQMERKMLDKMSRTFTNVHEKLDKVIANYEKKAKTALDSITKADISVEKLQGKLQKFEENFTCLNNLRRDLEAFPKQLQSEVAGSVLQKICEKHGRLTKEMSDFIGSQRKKLKEDIENSSNSADAMKDKFERFKILCASWESEACSFKVLVSEQKEYLTKKVELLGLMSKEDMREHSEMLQWFWSYAWLDAHMENQYIEDKKQYFRRSYKALLEDKKSLLSETMAKYLEAPLKQKGKLGLMESCLNEVRSFVTLAFMDAEFGEVVKMAEEDLTNMFDKWCPQELTVLPSVDDAAFPSERVNNVLTHRVFARSCSCKNLPH